MTVITEYIKPAQNYEMELEDILDAQMEKIAKDHEWMKDWSTNYEGYRPIGEANISIRPPINRTNSKTICTVKVPVKPPRSKGKPKNGTTQNSNVQKKSDESKQKQLLSENLKVQTDSRIDSDLKDIMDAQIEKIESDDQWAEKWMVDYEGYQPIGEPSLPLPRPTPLKTHKCKHCPELFSTPHHRKLHEIVHSNKRPFSCKFCPRTFKRKGDVKNHIITHAQDKSYICPVCDDTFPSEFARLRHIRKHTQKGDCTMAEVNKKLGNNTISLSQRTSTPLKTSAISIEQIETHIKLGTPDAKKKSTPAVRLLARNLFNQMKNVFKKKKQNQKPSKKN